MTLMDAEQGHCDTCNETFTSDGQNVGVSPHLEVVVDWIARWQAAHPMDYGFAEPDHQLDTPTTDGQRLEDAEWRAYRDYKAGVIDGR